MIELRNAFLTARFDERTGLLTHLSRGGSGRGVVAASRVGYGVVGENRAFESHRGDFEVVSLQSAKNQCATRLRSPHLEVALDHRLAESSPALEVRVTLRTLGVPAKLGELVAPSLDLTPSFNNVFEDPRDLWSDGAEVAPGLELPCWRVFFQRGHRTGLLLITRRRIGMARFNFRERAIDHEPPYAQNYLAVPHVREPLDASRSRVFESAFEVGPWSARQHAEILRRAGLARPVAVPHAKPRGAAPRKLRGVVFHAAQIAPRTARSTRYAADRWLVVEAPWSASGRLLFAPTGAAPPALVLRPKLRGPHRVFVGIANGPGIALRVSGERETRFRLRPGLRSDGRNRTFEPHLSGRQHAAETDFGVLEMHGKTIRLVRYPARQFPAAIDYVRFEPLDAAAAALWRETIRAEPALPLSGLTDTPDVAVIMDAQRPDPSAFASVIREHAACKVNKCYWRIDGQCSDFHSRTNTVRYTSAKVHGVFVPMCKAYGRALEKADPLKIAVDAGHRHGVAIYGWMRFNSYSGNVVSDFFAEHPEMHEVRENGRPAAKLCLAFPEVRRHKIDILLEAAALGVEGFCLGFLRTPPMVMHHPRMGDEYAARFGKQPPRDPNHADPMHWRTLPERSDPEFARWWRFRAGYLTAFGRELREALRRAGHGRLKIDLWLRPNHCLFDGIDMDAWLDEDLCDAVVTQGYVEESPESGLNWETPEWRQKVRAKVPLIRALPHSVGQARAMLPRVLAGGYDGICSYESNDTTMDREFIELFEGLRRAAPAASPDLVTPQPLRTLTCPATV